MLQCKSSTCIGLLEKSIFLLLKVCANFVKTKIMNLTALKETKGQLQYQWASRSSLNREKQTGPVFCICHISCSPWWPQCVSDALAHKGQIDTKEPGELEHCGKWLPCGHFEHARPSSPMCCLLLSLSRGTFFFSLCKDRGAALTETSHPIWWLLNTTWQPRAHTRVTEEILLYIFNVEF